MSRIMVLTGYPPDASIAYQDDSKCYISHPLVGARKMLRTKEVVSPETEKARRQFIAGFNAAATAIGPLMRPMPGCITSINGLTAEDAAKLEYPADKTEKVAVVTIRDGERWGEQVEFSFEKRGFLENRFFGPSSVTGDTHAPGLLGTHRIAAKDISAQDYLDLCSLDPNFQQTFSS